MPAVKKKRSKRLPRSKSPYADLAKELREIAVLASVGNVIGWDQETMMPEKGAALRAVQREAMSGLIHERRTSARLGDLIADSESWAKKKGDARALANLREARRDYTLATKLPASLVAEIARCTSLGMEAWKIARKESDFRKFLPWLKKTIDLARQKAKFYGPPASTNSAKTPRPRHELYDALLDEYEPGMTAGQTQAIFAPLRERLVPLIEAVAGSAAKPSDAPARADVPIDAQKAFVRLVCEKIGFDFHAGRIDESAHPFCEGLGPGDTRMTNRYRPDGWTDSLGTALHESGHAMYEQGLPKEEHFGQPIAEAVSLGIHESQSRMWENLVGRSLSFWTWASREAAGALGSAVAPISPAALHRAVNIVRPHLIRVESDELTYNLHIMLRFDLERAMVNGSMKPEDLPEAWNQRVKSDLGLDVPDDRRGCLQDVHWSAGLVGYFPTYTFGNLYASQFWEAMERALPARDSMIARGEFAPILAWLRESIHTHGRRYSAADLCRRVTGEPLSQDPLLRHLERKVRAVYG
jgi:carboxypeptidase Taq